MAKEDIVIDLASSDEDAEPPPAKKMNVTNAMVHIPTKMQGVTIKPVKAKSTEIPKLPKNITITKTTASPPSNKIKIPESIKRKASGKKVAIPITKGKVINPLNQMKKGFIIQSVGNSTITKLKTPILIKKPQINKPQPLQRLPPSITIKKTGTNMKPPSHIVSSKTIQQACKVVNSAVRKRKIMMPPVTLDDDVPSTSSNPQWYVRPEDQTKKDKTDSEEKAVSEEATTTAQENVNNKEPEGDKMIEITIEDSPIKPPKAKRARELSTEKVITIDDSPNKGPAAKETVAEGSDEEADPVKKDPQSKKKLYYEGNLQVIEEQHTLEIEFEPMVLDEDIGETHDNKVISLTPEIMEEEQASVEIAQNKQGEVSVIQIIPPKPTQPKVTSKEEILKKKAAIKSEFHPIYQAFITLCLKLENSDDMEKIIEKKIKPYYRQVPKEYAESDEFLDMVYSKITAIESAPAKLYLYIKDIVDELNLQRKIVRPPPVENKLEEQQSFLHGREQELTPRKQRQIRRLEVTLKKLNRAIQKLENQEVNFDDEEDSVYLLTEKYKERMVRVHAKFCQLTNTKLPTEPRLIIEARPGLSNAPAKKLEEFINQKNKVVFPDFHDVLRCVREANEENRLNWSEACIMEEARDLFVRCGRKIQRRRQENEWRLATSRITPNGDPAEQNEVLKNQLDANRRVANTKETEVFEEFCDKQSQMKLEAEEIDDKDAEGSPSESEEEDNEEPCSLENKQRRKERIKRLLQEISKKNNTNKIPETEQNISKEIEIESDADEESNVQTLSDDNEIGSDMDELNLLQKLHSGSERRTSDSSDCESPLSISDTLDSSSDDGKDTKPPSPEVVSIENSSYSDDSDSEKNKGNKEIESSSSRDVKNTHTSDIITESMAISSSDDESPDNTKAGKSDESVKKGLVTSDKDFECSILSETAELCEDINECAKPSDAEDERSLNSDTIENRGSSASSGQFEELLKEHNADPLLKQPDLIPRDPSDKLFDSLVMKHYNDPLVKAHLKGSDSSNGENPENSNSDTQSLDTPLTAEEAKKDLIETSVDTEELLSVSPSMQIVDKFIEKIKNSDGSQSSDELLRKVDDELDLNPEAGSPISLALEKAVTAARKTKAWPRFRDECSSLSSVEVEDDNISDNSPIMSKTNESPNDTDGWSLDSTKDASGGTDVKQNENNSTEPKACSSKKTLSEEMETADSRPLSNKNIKNAYSSSSSVEEESTYNDSPSIKTATSESTNENLDLMDIAQDEVTQAAINKTDTDDWSFESSNNITGATDIQIESNTTEPKASSSKSRENISEPMRAAPMCETATNKDLKNNDSSSCAIEDDNTRDDSPSMPTKKYETTNEMVSAQNAAKQTTDSDDCDFDSTKCAPEGTEVTDSDMTYNLNPTKNETEEMEAVTSGKATKANKKNTDVLLDIAEYCSTLDNSPSMPTKTNETANDNSDEMEMAQSDTDGIIEVNTGSLKSTKNMSKDVEVAPGEQDSNNDPFLDIAEYCRTLDNSPSMPTQTNETTDDATQIEVQQITDETTNIEKETDKKPSRSETVTTKDKNNDDSSTEIHVDNSECKNMSQELNDADFEMTSAESNIDAASSQTTKDVPEEMNTFESVTPLTETKLIDSTKIVDNSLANTEVTLQNNLNVDENKTEPPKPIVPEENLEVGSSFVEYNVEISDLLPTDSKLLQKYYEGEPAQGKLSETSLEKDCCDEEAPRTITNKESGGRHIAAVTVGVSGMSSSDIVLAPMVTAAIERHRFPRKPRF